MSDTPNFRFYHGFVAVVAPSSNCDDSEAFTSLSTQVGSSVGISKNYFLGLLTDEVRPAAFDESKSKIILISFAIYPAISGHLPSSQFVLIEVAIVFIDSDCESRLNRKDVYKSVKSAKVDTLARATFSTLLAKRQQFQNELANSVLTTYEMQYTKSSIILVVSTWVVQVKFLTE